VLRPIASFVRNSAHIAVVLSLAPLALLSTGCSSSSGDGTNPDGGAGASADDASNSGSSSGGGTTSGATSSGSSGATSSGASSGATSSGGSSGSTSSGGDAGPTGEAGSSGGGAGPASVVLGTAGNYAILAESAISNVPTSVITGDLGLSPAAASYVTGLSLTRAGVKWTAPQVVGSVFAADNDPPTPTNLTTAVTDMQTAYTDAAGRPTPTSLNLGGGAIGGMTLAPGLYKWTTAVTIPTDVAIAGAPDDAWIFQISGNLSMAAATKMTLSGGAQAKNIVWQVAGAVDLGTTSHAEGIVMSKTEITLETGASINGRLFAQTAVHIAGATVTAP
jgi:hypothetical protein